MCLILLAIQKHPHYPLIIIANRDEFHARPTASAHFWQTDPYLLAGQDLQSGGTWLGITQNGRFAALTNYREPQKQIHPHSRGLLVREFLTQTVSPMAYIQSCQTVAHTYNGYNLLVGSVHELWYYSNRGGSVRQLRKGLYGLSNAYLNTAWLKVRKTMAHFETVLAAETIEIETLFSILAKRDRATADSDLPQTGVSIEWERILSAAFIVSPERGYGTRCSTVLLVDTQGHISFTERTFNFAGETEKNVYYQFFTV